MTKEEAFKRLERIWGFRCDSEIPNHANLALDEPEYEQHSSACVSYDGENETLKFFIAAGTNGGYEARVHLSFMVEPQLDKIVEVMLNFAKPYIIDRM